MPTVESISQLNQLHLPGYGSTAALKDVIPASGNVLTLLIASKNPDTDSLEVLTSVRKPDQLYPWAISIATGMILPRDMIAIIDAKAGQKAINNEPVQLEKLDESYESELSRRRQVVRLYNPNNEQISASASETDSTLVRVTRELLTRKFDLDIEETHATNLGSISLHDISVGLVGATGMDLIEYNTSALAVVSLTDRSRIGAQTSGYQSNSWVTTEAFLEGYNTRDPEQLHPGIAGDSLAYVCTNGQCLRGAEVALQDTVSLIQHTNFA
jgi:hypothetical protein